MKRTLLTIAIAVLATVAVAKPVDPSRAIQVAQRYLATADLTATPLGSIYLVAPADGEGFVLVSADDCMRPVLAYSRVGRFRTDNIPANIQSWLDGYRMEIESCVAAGITPSAQVQAEWASAVHPRRSAGPAVDPLLTTKWDQDGFYNKRCPYDFQRSENCLTGCAATAMAQLMKYWNHPTTGRGSYSYTQSPFGTISADFGNTTYQWDSMPERLTRTSDSAAVEAVALLMYHAGVSVRMNYGVDGSGAALITYGIPNRPSAEHALRTYFRYNPMLRGETKSSYSDAEWDDMIYYEVSHRRPVLYGGFDSQGGHAFVLDGYDGYGMYHVNWGWGGYCDGYYTIDSLSPGAGGAGGNATYTFNEGNIALIGVEPSVLSNGETAIINMYADPAKGTVSGNGNYTPYADTAQIIAHAADGYRFVRWSHSGSTLNPLNIIVGGDITDTAIYAPIVGDTIAYSDALSVKAWHDDYRSRTEWGIRIPAERHAEMRRLSAVQLLVTQQDLYTLRIYLGDSICDETLVHEEDIVCDFSDSLGLWYTHTLSNPVALYGDKTLWITFYTIGGGHPASCAHYGGNSDGSWYRLPQGWVKYDEHGFYGTWMIRAILEERPFYVAVRPYDGCTSASVSGDGYFEQGESTVVSVAGGYLVDASGNPLGLDSVSLVVEGDTVFYYRCYPEGIAGIADPSSIRVHVAGHTVTAVAECDEPILLFDIEGRRLAAAVRNLKATVPSAGVYIVRCGASTSKIIVK